MLMESYPEKQETLPEQVKVCAVGTEQQCFACNLEIIKLLSRTCRLNKTHSLPASFLVFYGKKTVITLPKICRDAHEGSKVPVRRQKTIKTALSGYKTFFPGLLPKASLLKKAYFSISQSAVSFASCPKTLTSQSSPKTLSEPSYKSQLLTSILLLTITPEVVLKKWVPQRLKL